jgi:hypothetical protein
MERETGRPLIGGQHAAAKRPHQQQQAPGLARTEAPLQRSGPQAPPSGAGLRHHEPRPRPPQRPGKRVAECVLELPWRPLTVTFPESLARASSPECTALERFAPPAGRRLHGRLFCSIAAHAPCAMRPNRPIVYHRRGNYCPAGKDLPKLVISAPEAIFSPATTERHHT